MGDLRRKSCKGGCDRTVAEVGELSWNGYCFECGQAKREANIRQLAAHRGPWFDHWRRRTAASVGGVLLDDVQASP
jgi:hypothetical protein